MKHWFEFRLILEPPNARLAAQNATKEEREEITRLARELAALVEEGKPFTKEDQAFHTAIATATSIGKSQVSSQNAVKFHQAVADCIALGDAEGAEMAMRFHILHGLRDLDAE